MSQQPSSDLLCESCHRALTWDPEDPYFNPPSYDQRLCRLCRIVRHLRQGLSQLLMGTQLQRSLRSLFPWMEDLSHWVLEINYYAMDVEQEATRRMFHRELAAEP